MSATTDTTPKTKGGWWALSPLAVFLCLYLVTSLLVNDFYKVPITVAFLASSCYAIAITRGLNLEQALGLMSIGYFLPVIEQIANKDLREQIQCRVEEKVGLYGHQ